MQEIQIWSLDWENPLEKETATHSSILAWKIPWAEEPGRLQSMGSRRVRHDWNNYPKQSQDLGNSLNLMVCVSHLIPLPPSTLSSHHFESCVQNSLVSFFHKTVFWGIINILKIVQILILPLNKIIKNINAFSCSVVFDSSWPHGL